MGGGEQSRMQSGTPASSRPPTVGTGSQRPGEPPPRDRLPRTALARALHGPPPGSSAWRAGRALDLPLTTRRQKTPWPQSSAAPNSSETTRLIAARLQQQVSRAAKAASAHCAARARTPGPPCLLSSPTPAAQAQPPGLPYASPLAGPGAGRAGAARECAGLERTTRRVHFRGEGREVRGS